MRRFKVKIEAGEFSGTRKFREPSARDALFAAARWAWAEYDRDVTVTCGRHRLEGGPPPMGVTEYRPDGDVISTDFAGAWS